MKSLFSPKDVVSVVGISYRQLQYWDKTSFIKPSAIHMGKYRNYTFQELVQLKLAKILRESNVSIQKLRKVLESVKDLLPKVGCPLAECAFLIDGEKVLIFNGDVVMDPETSKQFFRFEVRALREEVDRIFPDKDSVQLVRSAVS
ncbi:MAG: MerR family transcriptional regulator [Candidatus Wallbacteria bacterium]|nr:MerR family transcriptional regulator [Candidatus Wallbacteria bacterium]